MRRRYLWVLFFACLVMVCALSAVVRKPRERPIYLKIARRSVEQGKPVVYFRLQGTNSGALGISQVTKIGPFKPQPAMETVGDIGFPAVDFWAPFQVEDPISRPESMQNEFGVLAPTNSGVWRVQVELVMPDPHSIRRFTSLASEWQVPLKDWPDAISFRYNFPYTHRRVVESEPLTNAPSR
jgi:hypothetical protein